ncbi:MAG: hypothetical protein JNK82_26185 [Myxococcaceae bacterium]|nr:hypothetical protein [Myxococcaceae bacterium]
MRPGFRVLHALRLLHREQHVVSSGALRLLELFAARPMGARQWFRTMGTSMVPLLLSGDDLLVERCESEALREGDIAVMLLGGQFVAHVVSAVSPLITSSYLGVRDPQPGRTLGRAVAVRRFGRELPLPAPAVLVGHRALSNPLVRETVKGAVNALLNIGRPVRRLLVGAPAVRVAEAEELERAVQLASGVLGGSVIGSVMAAGARGDLWVATSQGGRWLGVAWRSTGVSIAVPVWARNLGVEEQLERALA